MRRSKRSILFLILAFILISNFTSADVWHKDIFDSTGTANGTNCAIALDQNGNPHISYAKLDNLFLYYAHYNGTSWTIQSVDSFGIAGLQTSIVLDSNDYPHIAYTGHASHLRHAYFDGADWHSELVDSGIVSPGMQGFRNSIVLDYEDNPHIAYADDTLGAVMYAHFDGNYWNYELIQDISETFYIKLKLIGDTLPVIAYHVIGDVIDGDTLRVAYKETPNGDWNFSDVPEDICLGQPFFRSFDIDVNGDFYYLYDVSTVPMVNVCGGYGNKKIAKFDGSAWSFETVTVPGDPTDYLSFPLFLRFDNNGNPAFLADTILYWKSNGTDWSYYNLGNQFGDDFATYEELVFDEFNYPHMVFGNPWVSYYKLYPGDPEISVPNRSHTYAENYTTWSCLIQSVGAAPVRVDSLKFAQGGGFFDLAYDASPFYIHQGESDSLSVIFMPDDEITYYDTLIIYSNDLIEPIIRVALEGTGSFDPATGELLLVINDVYASPEYHAINYNKLLDGVNVSLYQGGLLQYGPFVSNVVGLALQSNIVPGSYELKLEKILQLPRDDGKTADTLQLSESISIGTGLTIDTLIFPESLIVQSYQWVYDLSNISYGDVIFAYGAESHNPGNIRDMLDIWIDDLDSDKIESAARLLLAQEVIDRMFRPESSLGRQGIDGIGDLVHYIMKTTDELGGWLTKLIKLVKIIWNLYGGDRVAALMELLQFLAEYIILEIVDTMIDRVGDELPCIEDPMSGGQWLCGKEIIKTAWKEIKSEYSSWQLPDFDEEDGPENSLKHCQQLVFDKAKVLFVQGVYVDIFTNPLLETAKEKSEAFNYTSDFPTASESSNDEITATKVLADDLNTAAGVFLFNADLLNKLVVALNAISNFLPTPGWLETVKTASMYAAIGSAATGTSIALGGFFAIPSEIKTAVNTVYDPGAKFANQPYQFADLPTAKADGYLIKGLKTKIQKAAEEYDSIVTSLQTHIQTQEIDSAIFTTGDLALADVNLMNTVEVSTAPAYAVAHALYDSMPGFSGIYDALVTDFSDAGMTRFFSYLSLIQFPGDSSQEMKDYLVAHLDTVLMNNQTWTNSSMELLDSILGVEIPAIVVASEASQNKFGLDLVEDTATITIVLQNVGAVTADDISIIFETNEGLMSTDRADSVYVGSLTPGEESGVYKWTVVVDDTTYNKGMWEARVVSSNAKTYSPDGSIVAKINAPLGVDGIDDIIIPEKFQLNQNYPNPFNPSTKIEYYLPRRSDVVISVFNILGRKVVTLVDENQPAGNNEVTWNGTDSDGEPVASGIYFYRLVTGNDTQTRKMVLLK